MCNALFEVLKLRSTFNVMNLATMTVWFIRAIERSLKGHKGAFIASLSNNKDNNKTSQIFIFDNEKQ